MTLEDFKKELESALLITEWTPTEEELAEIVKRLKEFDDKPSKPNIEKIVLDVVGSYTAMSLEGADSSDLTTLLKLATKTSSNDD